MRVTQRATGATYGMCGCSAHGSIPPFTGCQMWTVYLEFLLGRVPCRCCFEPAHVAAVAEFSLRIASNDVVIEDLGHPVCLLFL